ncbi:aldo/keto reductase [Synoicihabitans lomoniglobus]|uniref:Aldo/keto reductase n=1 Tax=Synoicihabitans lomoniglobus TaxID=2909285 RepID=A0AAF0CG04_9BACT|nr:aldo/keto reductase [Opitutaceae bacterium LMO-M01]WED63032.1 aldo/keto reductase [Opitutaceae bacterium LMO-M01]
MSSPYVTASDRYSQVPYERCGRSGLKLPRLSLGLWHNFGGVDVFENGRTMCRAAFDMGITHFDLANNYGPPPGSAEANFGKILDLDLGVYRDELIISTKAGYDMWEGPYGEWGSRKYLIASLDQSLDRLGLDYVDIFYSHRPDPDTPMEETMGALASIYHGGKALYIGLSNYDAAQTRLAHEILDDLGVPLLIHQPRYNLLDRWVEPELLPLLTELGVGCIPFSPLAQGQLTSRYLKTIPTDSRAGKGGFLNADTVEANHPKILALAEIAEQRGQTLAQMALTWVLRQPAITTVLIGASSVPQIEENVACASAAGFSDEELKAIDAACA